MGAGGRRYLGWFRFFVYLGFRLSFLVLAGVLYRYRCCFFSSFFLWMLERFF